MTEVGEGVVAAIVKALSSKYLFAAIVEVKFESGHDLWDVDSGGAETQVPAAGTAHWGTPTEYAALYPRAGGADDVKIKVKWNQKGYDGTGKLKGVSDDGEVIIEGDVPVAGEKGDAVCSCKLTKRPAKVKNYGVGLAFTWTLTAGGDAFTPSGASRLKLYFTDAVPKPVGWGYKRHYLQAVDWATAWAQDKAGGGDVFNALWDKFSDGKGPRTSHATGFSYWKTRDCAQTLTNVVRPGFAAQYGWSCRGIAHLFMECMALHGLTCLEVIPNTAGGTRMFLVKNWQVDAVPKNALPYAGMHYAGSWASIDTPPLNKPVTSVDAARTWVVTGPAPKGGGPVPGKWVNWTIDCKKQPGVPAQGQTQAPLGFSNHWIVQANGMLYDTSYGGGGHANDINAYTAASIDGWMMGGVPDKYEEGALWWVTKKDCMAWLAKPYPSGFAMIRANGSSN